jgi:predicted RNase H-like nuclease (RuvC/YqgF family)
MSEAIKKIVGEDLYNQITAKGLNPDKFDLLENYVPKDSHLPKTRYNEIKEKLTATEEKIKTYESQLKEYDKLIKDSEAFKAENEGFKTKLSDLETKYTNDLKVKDKQIENVLKKSLVKEHLITNGAQYIDLLIDKVNFDTVKVENDKLTGFDDQFKSMKENYKGLFIETTNKQDGNTPQGGNDSGNTGGDNKWSSYVDNMFK